MDTTANQQMLQAAVSLHRQGQWAAAEARYRHVVAAEPRHSEALRLLGVLLVQTGRAGEAIGILEQSIHARANVSATHMALGEAYRAAGRIREAAAAFRQALVLEPFYAEAHNNLGAALE